MEEEDDDDDGAISVGCGDDVDGGDGAVADVSKAETARPTSWLASVGDGVGILPFARPASLTPVDDGDVAAVTVGLKILSTEAASEASWASSERAVSSALSTEEGEIRSSS